MPFKDSIFFITSSLDWTVEDPVKANLSRARLIPLGYDTSKRDPAFTSTRTKKIKLM